MYHFSDAQSKMSCKDQNFRLLTDSKLEMGAPIVDMCSWVDIAMKLKSPPLSPGLHSLASTKRRTSGSTATPWAKILSPSSCTKVG